VPELLTKAEVAGLLKLSPRSVGRLRRRGDLPALKIPSSVRFRKEDVQADLAAQLKGAAR
jgi:excisionase family DNA binding protein